MKLAVVGSRTWNDYKRMAHNLDCIYPTTIISGGARGADKLAAQYATERGLKLIEFLPDWKRDGRSAGYKRNQYIVDEADKVIVFWDGRSRGAQHTMRLAEKAGKLFGVVRAAVGADNET